MLRHLSTKTGTTRLQQYNNARQMIDYQYDIEYVESDTVLLDYKRRRSLWLHVLVYVLKSLYRTFLSWRGDKIIKRTWSDNVVYSLFLKRVSFQIVWLLVRLRFFHKLVLTFNQSLEQCRPYILALLFRPWTSEQTTATNLFRNFH